MKFFRVPDPTDDDIAILVKRIRDRVVRYLEKKGHSIDDFSQDPFAFEQPVMAELTGASIQSRIALGERAGQKVRRIGSNASVGEVYRVGKRCVSKTEEGKILYRLKTQYSDGTTHVLFDPLELVEKVVALIPPPRANLLRYHGVFAPNSKDRKKIVPALPKDSTENEETLPNLSWSELLKRSFGIDVMVCGSCGGKMRFISHIEEPVVVTRILGHLGLPTEAPQLFPPRAPPQAELFESQSSENDEFYQPSFD